MSKTTTTKPRAHDAIRKVLETDIDSYLARDRDAWLQCWIDDARFRSVMECGTMQIARSFDEFRRNVFEAMDAEPDPVQADVQLKNLEIHISNNVAWATYEEIVTSASNPRATPSHSHNFRLLEYGNGAWRILFHGCWAEPLRDTEDPALEVAKDGRVLWANDVATAELKNFRGLVISNGKLRASKPSWTSELHCAISRAHNLTAFGNYNRAKSEGGGEVQYPVVLGENNDGGLMLCWVKVVDARVYILFGSGSDLSKQIDVAQAIFALSKAQTDMVRLIAKGMELSDAAEALGVTKNTARTHLRRVYEKVGVNSQIELLRLIISFST
ncbi:Bacterial regulatory protein, luxR family [Shimia sp. SK013]|uniref:LuxR C-terminal-related transcriptional regulator n=1 Tax=Shimia sp. SK013 TaxID=1389006 RepID=UPI0006CDC3D6|nr:LuxR C-terminal-related transcriptional regulator [Shimia sp. SK013]KPA21642.1 Bacterial regulatory protein, luxR family [Shimia sp. SK013]